MNNTATSKTRAVIQAMDRYYERDNANVHRGIHELSTVRPPASQAVRAGGGISERAEKGRGASDFTRGTTEGINLVGRGPGETAISKPDYYLLDGNGAPQHLVPWQLLAERSGANSYFCGHRQIVLLDLSRVDESPTRQVASLLAMVDLS